MNYSASTGDTQAIRAATKGCTSCRSFMQLYEKTRNAGGFSEDPGWSPRNIIADRNGQRVTVLVDVKTEPFAFSPRRGVEPREVKATTYRLRFEVALETNRWRVALLEERVDLS